MFSIIFDVVAMIFQYNGDLWLARYDGFVLHMSIIPTCIANYNINFIAHYNEYNCIL